jgi:hypothetical protein
MVCLCAVELVTLVCSIELESGAAVESVLALVFVRLAYHLGLLRDISTGS